MVYLLLFLPVLLPFSLSSASDNEKDQVNKPTLYCFCVLMVMMSPFISKAFRNMRKTNQWSNGLEITPAEMARAT